MATVSREELLEKVDNAIIAIAEGGQSYKIGSRSLTRGDLNQLYQIKNDLTAQLSQGQSSGLFDNCYEAIFNSR